MRSGRSRKTAAKTGYSRRLRPGRRLFSTTGLPPPPSVASTLTRHRRRHRVVVLRAQRVVDLDFLRELLDGQSGQAPTAELLRRRSVHLHVAGGRQDLLADVQHAAGYVQVVVRDQVAAHLARPPDALLERRTCNQFGRGSGNVGFPRPSRLRSKTLCPDRSSPDKSLRVLATDVSRLGSPVDSPMPV